MGYIKPVYYDTLTPYKTLPYEGIQYTSCRDYKHISRYKGLRQIVYAPDTIERLIGLETVNTIKSKAKFTQYEVPYQYENRLDLIAYKFFGSAQYSWILSYFNNIEDGFTVLAGQKLLVLNNFNDLFNDGEVLASIAPYSLNLGEE